MSSVSPAAVKERVLCYCFGVTEKQVIDHLSRLGETYETLVANTRIGTKCTACLLDLDLAIQKSFKMRLGAVRRRSRGARASGRLSVAADETNTGYVINAGGIDTTLRIANHGMMFDPDTGVPEFTYRLKLFDRDGRVCHRLKGELAPATDLEVAFGALPGCPDLGWFWVALEARDVGFLGSVRPQILLRGPHWAAAYHSQPLAMADYDKFIVLRSELGATRAVVPAINPNAGPATLSARLSDLAGPWRAERVVTIPAHGVRLVAIDELFPDLPAESNLMLSLDSDLPTQKNIVNRHSDGSWNVDHLPNKK